MRDALADGFDRAVFKRGGMNALRCWFADETLDVSIELHFQGPEFSGKYCFSFGSSTADEYGIKSEKLSLTNHQIAASPLFEVVDGQLVQIPERIDGILMRHPKQQNPKTVSKRSFYLSQLGLVVPTIQAVRDFLINMNFSRGAGRKQYDLVPNSLRKPQQSTLSLPLWENGENLGSTLKEIQRRKKDYLITEALEVIVPGISGYSIIPVDQHLITKLHYAFENAFQYASENGSRGQKKVQSALSHEANGTIRMLATLAALYQDRFPSPLVIEEPEKEIFPDALAVCGDVLQEAALSYQVLVTTHSPDLIIYLPVDSLRVVERENGITKVGPLSDHQQEAIAENLFSPGALMRIQGLERKRVG